MYTVFTREKRGRRKIKEYRGNLPVQAARKLCSELNHESSPVWYEFTTEEKFRKKSW